MLTLKSPAKINWFLFVLGKRPDGYHEILTLMQKISLYDTLTFERPSQSPGQIEVVTESPIGMRDNLVSRAAELLKCMKGADMGARITLKKDIPLSAGLAGGSSDAASAIMGLDKFWGLGLKKSEMLSAASSLGSDIPFFLNGESALAEGRGERITPVQIKAPYHILLVKPGAGVSSGWAYSNVAEYMGLESPEKEKTADALVRAINNGDFGALRRSAVNSLELPVMGKYPVIKEIKERLYAEGALFSAMSGSGSTVFGVFEDEGKAAIAKGAFPGCWTRVVRTLVP